MIRARRAAVVYACVCACACALRASTAEAQSAVDERGRFEVAAGPTWTGGTSFGLRAATETAPAGRFQLFTTSSQLAAAAGIEARVGIRLCHALQAEGSSSYGHPQLRVSLSGDAEHAADATASEAIHQFTFDGAIVWQMERWRIGRRATPFVSAGAGYLRQLHEGGTLVATGQTYHVGGGVKYLLVSRDAKLKGLGVRADVRALVRAKGVAVDGGLHVSPAIAGSIFVRF
jgi:hypothetical protein